MPDSRAPLAFPLDPSAVMEPLAAAEARLVYAEVQAVLRTLHADRPAAFDLDDTIVTGGTRTSRLPADVLATRHAIAWTMGRLLEEGRRVVVVTGREEETQAWQDLMRALEEVSGAPLDAALLARVAMACGGAWMGTQTAVARKVKALRAHDAALLVGDLDHLDGRAARAAGVPYIDVGPRATARRLGG